MKEVVLGKSGLHTSAIKLNTHAFQDLGGVQCLGHDYRRTDRHEETKECTETGQALLADASAIKKSSKM